MRLRLSRTTRDTPAIKEALVEEKSQIEEYNTKMLEQRNIWIRSKTIFFIEFQQVYNRSTEATALPPSFDLLESKFVLGTLLI
jgi:hypothetical protein